MGKCIMVGIDLHEARMLAMIGEGRERCEQRTVENTPEARRALWQALKKRAGGGKEARVVVAYEASGLGFGMCDEAEAAGIECHVLAPTRIARSAQHRRRKTDAADAKRLLEIVRGHVLGGNEWPEVWRPDPQTRDDREVVRTRLDVAEKLTAVKAQIQCLLKRNGLRRREGTGKGWTGAFVAWLRGLCAPASPLVGGARQALASLLRQKDFFEAERNRLDEAVGALALTPRYLEPVRALHEAKGVGVLTAMVYLTELGDLTRFRNRKAIGAYLGAVPASAESGTTADRKGHITHQGPWRVRRVLCQCVWSRLRTDPREKAVYDRLVAKNPKHKKIAVVALMRRLAILLWHLGRDAQVRHGSFSSSSATHAA